MPEEEEVSLSQHLQVKLVQTPSINLGLNFKFRGRRVADFQDLIVRFQSKLQSWKAKLLSQAGRTTLISSILQAMHLYTFSCFRVPETVCKKLDCLTRAFWRGHEPHLKNSILLIGILFVNPKRKEASAKRILAS